jgi:TonB family protein
MHATATVLTIAIAAAAQQAPVSKSYAEGQEVRVCGEVKMLRALPPACDTTMRVASGGEEFDVVIPASVARDLNVRPQAMRGGEACFTGRIAVSSGIPKVNVASEAGVQLVSTNLDPNFGAEAAVPCGTNVTLPRVIKERHPQYTSTAMREKAQGSVEVQAVVDVDGTVTQARIVRSLHPELDEQAILAVKQWRFAPGTMNGNPVPVLVEIELTFTLRSGR